MQTNVFDVDMGTRSSRQKMLNRFIVGMSGQVFARLIVAATAIALVPLMLRAWGVAGYGEWIAVTSLASYLGYSNFGFVTPAVNEIVMRAGAGEIDKASHQFRMSISFSLFVVCPIVLVVALGLSTLDFETRFHFTVLTNAECAVIIVACAANLMTETLRGVMVAPLYAQGAYGRVYFTDSLIRLAELIIVAALLLGWRTSAPTVAWTSAAVSVVNVLVTALFARLKAPWVSFLPHRLNTAWISRQVKPTLGFMMYNLGTQGVLVLGPRALLSVVSGGSAVAVYALYGTVMRVVDQIVWIFVAPLEVEMARSVGRGDLDRATKLIRVGTQGAWIVFIGVSLGIAMFAPHIFGIWTRHQITFEYHLLVLACAMFGCSNFGKVSAHALIATNRLYGTSFLIAIWSVLAVGIGVLLSLRSGVEGMFLGGIIGQLGVSLIAIFAVASWLKLSVWTLLFDFSTIRSTLDLLLRRSPAL